MSRMAHEPSPSQVELCLFGFWHPSLTTSMSHRRHSKSSNPICNLFGAILYNCHHNTRTQPMSLHPFPTIMFETVRHVAPMLYNTLCPPISQHPLPSHLVFLVACYSHRPITACLWNSCHNTPPYPMSTSCCSILRLMPSQHRPPTDITAPC